MCFKIIQLMYLNMSFSNKIESLALNRSSYKLPNTYTSHIIIYFELDIIIYRFTERITSIENRLFLGSWYLIVTAV